MNRIVKYSWMNRIVKYGWINRIVKYGWINRIVKYGWMNKIENSKMIIRSGIICFLPLSNVIKLHSVREAFNKKKHSFYGIFHKGGIYHFSIIFF